MKKRLSGLYTRITDLTHEHPVLTGVFVLPLGTLLFISFLKRCAALETQYIYSLVTPTLVFLGGLFAASVAVRNTKASAILARDKATLDLIIKEETDSYILKKREAFLRLRSEGNLIQWSLKYGNGKFKPKDNDQEGEEKACEKEQKDAMEAIGFVLNKYEMIAIGIYNDILSEKIYTEWLGTTLVQDWHELSPLVAQIREMYKKPKLYQFFERLALNIEEKKQS